MSTHAELYVSSKNGRITGLTEAFPAQELKKGEFEITREEWKLLYAISDLDKIEFLVKSIRDKMKNSEE